MVVTEAILTNADAEAKGFNSAEAEVKDVN